MLLPSGAVNPDSIKALLEAVAAGATSTDDAMRRLANLPFEDHGYARIDHHRELRLGLPEVVYGAGKSTDQVVGIARALRGQGQVALVTRASGSMAAAAMGEFGADAKWHEAAGCLVVQPKRKRTPKEPTGHILIVTAGTSDIPVAEEARVTAETFGNKVTALHDVGVSGIHRVMSERTLLLSARVIVVVAGMEGALASVVGGLVPRPVVAVPTSVGYGASFGGLAALLAMLNSCAAGVTVVNIDNGFGAAYAATRINRIDELG